MNNDKVRTLTLDATGTIGTLAYQGTDEYGIPLDLNSGGVSANAPPRYGWLGGAQRSGDALGGTILMGSRVYAPGVGRFLSIDPTPGGNANVYDYCTADPINCSDLTGNWPDWGAVLNVVAVVAEVVATVVPGPIGTAAGFISAGAYLATGNTEKATEMAITATAQLIGAGLAAKAAVKAVQYASKIGRAVSGAVKTARVAVAESRVGRAAERILSKGCNCFIAGTLVDTDHGPVPIEQIQVGDQVWARDLDTGTNEPCAIWADSRRAGVGPARQDGRMPHSPVAAPVAKPASWPRCSILPGYLLRRLAQADDEHVAAAATRTLAADATLRERRTVVAERSTRMPPPRGLVPPDLTQRTAALETPRPQRVTVSLPAAPERSIHDAEHLTRLPGRLVRAEGADPVADVAVNEAYDGLGATWELYWTAYQRDSLDAKGLPLLASVHFDVNYDNAFWDGAQMVFGDGDGRYFDGFTSCIDVIGHELTHGFTQYTAGLTYVGQSGALNESISDVFGVLTAQHHLGQTADEASWLVGEGLFTDRVKGVALRSMKAPGTAYDDPVLGRDPQPAHMRDFVDLPHDAEHDNGGVHTNSGIPNHAFYLVASALGGPAWERAGRIWFDTMTTKGIPKDIDFAGFAGRTIAAATKRYGKTSPEAGAVHDAWASVGVEPTATGHPTST